MEEYLQMNDGQQQAVIKDGWQKLGIETELKAIEANSYFASASNPDAVIRFQADVVMLTVPFTSPFPAALMRIGGETPGGIAAALELVLEGLHLSKRLNKDPFGPRSLYTAR